MSVPFRPWRISDSQRARRWQGATASIVACLTLGLSVGLFQTGEPCESLCFAPIFLFLTVCCFVIAIRRLTPKSLPGSICIHCGYDLRASRDRCPECGATCVDPNPGSQLFELGDEAKCDRR